MGLVRPSSDVFPVAWPQQSCLPAKELCSISAPGAGLALVIPSGQSLVADYYSAGARGSAFGALYLTSALGGMGGSIVATNLGGGSLSFCLEP